MYTHQVCIQTVRNKWVAFCSDIIKKNYTGLRVEETDVTFLILYNVDI